MEEFLRDNPDYGLATTPASNNTAPNTASLESSQLNDIGPFLLGADNQYDYSGKQGTTSGWNSQSGTQLLNPNQNYYKDDFLSPTTSYGNDANSFGLNYDPQMEELYQTTSYPGSITNDPPNMQLFLPHFGSPTLKFGNGGFMEPQNASNLDKLISPSNTISGNPQSFNNNTGSFISPQYFSPNTKTNYGSLNPIVESGGVNLNDFNSPEISRRESLSIPLQQTNSNNMYAPNQQSYMSPPSQMDFLRSPSNNGAYLSSPPNDFLVLPNNKAPINIPSKDNYSNLLGDQYNTGGFNSNVGSFNDVYDNKTTNRDNYNNLNSNNSTGPINFPKALDSSLLNPQVPTVAATSPNSSSLRLLTKEEKLKRRREFHNAVERRRRDLIKERIKQLGLLVPQSLLNAQLVAVQTLQNGPQTPEIVELLSSVKAKELKPNKSTILNMSVEYLKHLEYVLEEQKATQEKLKRDIESLERQLGSIGLENRNLNEGSGLLAQQEQQELTENYNAMDFVNYGQLEDTGSNIDLFDPDQFFQTGPDVYTL